MSSEAVVRRVLIVDGQPVVRHGLRRIVQDEADLAVCGETDSARRARALVKESHPDVVILDIALDQGDGIELLRDLRAHHPRLRVLVFSALDETIYAERMLSVGANGYLMKRAAPEQLVQALRQVLEGKHYVSPEIGDSILRHYAGGSSQPLARPLERLTNRELQVMHMIAEGMTTRRMAALLHLSVKTVESHRQRIKRKLNLDSGVQLVRFAVTILSAVGESRPGETVDRAIEPAAVEDD